MAIYFAPLEGITGFIFRNAYDEVFGNVDKYFAPFISPTHNKVMAGKEIRDIIPENNTRNMNLIPQMLCSNSEYFIKGARQVIDMGYTEINFNAGCPSNTVVPKGRGAGFLRDTEYMERFFDDIFEWREKEAKDIKLSVKTRIGVNDKDEFIKIMEVYNKFPFCEIIVHPRTRIQMYKDKPQMDSFEYALKSSVNPVCYNGDIKKKKDYDDLMAKFCNVDSVMIGRGILANPCLVDQIRNDSKVDYYKVKKFHDRLYSDYREVVKGDVHTLFKMKELWFYLSELFEDSHKCLKMVRKAQKLDGYERAVDEIWTKHRPNQSA